MKLSKFGFELPEELLAEYPAENRDESRLMVLNREKQTIEHKQFKDLIEYFDDEDVLIMNNTKVFPARMIGNKEKTGAEIEVFLLRELNQETLLWDVLVDPARKIRIGNKLYFGEDEELVAEVIDNTTSRGRTLRFLFDGTYEEFQDKVRQLGKTPLPKYIKRAVEPEDEERYQTIYARHEGSVAAPTAGLHFSKNLLKRLEIKGVNFAEVTISSFQNLPKEYTATIKLGATTPSYDLETEVDKTFEISKITENDIMTCAASFIGEQDQLPPIFSAKKIDGKRAYNLARAGEEVKVKPNKISIYEMEVLEIKLPEVKVRIACSKGTYIRSIAYDFGVKLNNGAHLTELRRTKIGEYDVNDAHTIEEVQQWIFDSEFIPLD